MICITFRMSAERELNRVLHDAHGEITDLYSFCLINYPTCVDGFNPTSLILGKDGNFYGTTSGGGTTFGGVIFKLTPEESNRRCYTLCPDARLSGWCWSEQNVPRERWQLLRHDSDHDF